MERRDGIGISLKKFLTRPTIVIAVLILIGLAALGAVAMGGKKSHQQPSPATRSSKAATRPTPTPAPVKLTSSPTGVVLDRPGAIGTKQFTAAGDWGFDWSFDCTQLGIPSNFLVSVYDNKGRVSTDTPPVIQFGPTGNGTKQYHKPGTYFLGVNTKCDWHITAKAGTPQPSP